MNREVFETSDVDSDTVDVRNSDIRNQEIKQEARQKQSRTSSEGENTGLEAKLEQVKEENQSLEAKFSQVFGELSERLRQQNIRVERGTKVNMCVLLNKFVC